MDSKQRFYRHFQDSTALLEDQIQQLASLSTVAGERQEAIDHVLAGVAKLQNEVADASSETPAYDRKQYSETVKNLQDKLNETVLSLTPKSRFQFKKRSGTAHVDMGLPENDPRLHPGSYSINPHLQSPNLELAQRISDGEGDDDAVGELPSSSRDYNEELSQPSTASVRKPSFSDAKQIGISNQKGLHIILPSSAARATAAGSLTNISNCIVDMSIPTVNGQPFLSLALRNITKCLIVAGRVAGPVHITNLSDSIVVVLAHQVRIHDCSNVDIYLHCTSHPIIEDCSVMRFAPLPACYVTGAEEAIENQWAQVDDFKWLKAGHSPNWKILPDTERLANDIWTQVVPGQPGLSVNETLQKIGIS